MKDGWKIGLITCGVFVLGCSAKQKPESADSIIKDLNDVNRLIQFACPIQYKFSRVDGVVAMKVKSVDTSGQFPADVAAESTGRLRMEITNLIGGTEAIIRIDAGTYHIEVPGKPERTEKGYGSWGGIPLRWATDLFLGRIPCPSAQAASDKKLLGPGVLQIKTQSNLQADSEIFTYRWNLKNPTPFPEILEWERTGPFEQKISFRFEDPDTALGSPRKWEAKSAQGEVKVRWKSRKIK